MLAFKFKKKTFSAKKKKKSNLSINFYKKIIRKRRFSKRKLIKQKKTFQGPRPRNVESYKFHKWKYNFFYKQKYLKEKNQWFTYLLFFRKYYSYRYCLTPELVQYFRKLFIKKNNKLMAFTLRLENRLTSVLVKSGCVWNYLEAFWLLKNNYILVNASICTTDKIFLKIHDTIQINYSAIKNEKYKFFRFLTSYRFIFKIYVKKFNLLSIIRKYQKWNTMSNTLQISYFKSRIIIVSHLLKIPRTTYRFYSFLLLYY